MNKKYTVAVKAISSKKATQVQIIPNTTGCLTNAVTDMMWGVLSNIDVDVLVNVNVNMFAVSMAAFEFVMSDPLEEFRC